MKITHTTVDNLDALAQFATELSAQLKPHDIVYLHGNLGAGKTTMVKYVIAALGFSGHVKSPTFTLVETYPFGDMTIQHFDLYRLTDPEELEWIGIRDYFNHAHISFIEWPEKGDEFLPTANIEIFIEYNGESQRREIEVRFDRV